MELTLKAIQIAKEAHEAVVIAQKAYERTQPLIREAVAAEYPLSSLVGKDYIYTRAMWGTPDKGVTDAEFLERHKDMQAYQLEFGTNPANHYGFEQGAIYACYVCLEHDSSWNDAHPEFWELLFVKVN
jgi:hypothetical protein